MSLANVDSQYLKCDRISALTNCVAFLFTIHRHEMYSHLFIKKWRASFTSKRLFVWISTKHSFIAPDILNIAYLFHFDNVEFGSTSDISMHWIQPSRNWRYLNINLQLIIKIYLNQKPKVSFFHVVIFCSPLRRPKMMKFLIHAIFPLK